MSPEPSGNDDNSSGEDGKVSANSSAYYGATETVSRVDYCFDFIMDADFMPCPEHFVAHPRVKKAVYGEKEVTDTYSAMTGDNILTVRLGKMPGRQVTIYNKLEDIGVKGKRYMWDIWGLNEEEFKRTGKEIWRVEVRAGKGELQNWNIKRFEDFEKRTGDMLHKILEVMRLTAPTNSDTNRSRWPTAPIWQSAMDRCDEALATYSSGANRGKILEDFRENVIAGYQQRLIGNSIGMLAAKGQDLSEFSSVTEGMEKEFLALADSDLSALERKYAKNEERFKFLV